MWAQAVQPVSILKLLSYIYVCTYVLSRSYWLLHIRTRVLTNNNIMHVWHVNASGRSSVKLLHGVIDVGDIAFICPTYSAHESTSGWFGSATTLLLHWLASQCKAYSLLTTQYYLRSDYLKRVFKK